MHETLTEERKAELLTMIKKMEAASNDFYRAATQTGVHSFIEFTGIMNEYIKVCQHALAKGIDFSMANSHNTTVLPMERYHLNYLGEKVNCIYGNALRQPDNLPVFIDAIKHG